MSCTTALRLLAMPRIVLNIGEYNSSKVESGLSRVLFLERWYAV